MAVVLPILAVAGGVSAGMAIAAGAAVTFAGAMAVAGGMAAGLGLISGDKDFQRLGSMLSMASGLAGAFSGAAQGAGVIDSAATAGDYANQMDLASDAASAASKSSGSLGYGIEGVGDYSAAGQAAPQAADMGQYANETAKFARQGQAPQTFGGTPQDIAGQLTGSEGGILSKAYQTAQTAPLGATAPVAATPAGTLAEVAQGITQNDITSMLQRGAEKAGSLMGQAWDGAGKALNTAGQWVQKNPQAASMVFNAVGNAFGPEAEAMDLRKSLMERARQNVNSPVRLQYLTPKTA